MWICFFVTQKSHTNTHHRLGLHVLKATRLWHDTQSEVGHTRTTTGTGTTTTTTHSNPKELANGNKVTSLQLKTNRIKQKSEFGTGEEYTQDLVVHRRLGGIKDHLETHCKSAQSKPNRRKCAKIKKSSSIFRLSKIEINLTEILNTTSLKKG